MWRRRIDTVTIGAGADQIMGSPGDLDGDAVTDLEQSDTLVFTNVSFDNGDVTVIPGPPPALQIDTDADGNTDTTIMLGRLPGEGVMFGSAAVIRASSSWTIWSMWMRGSHWPPEISTGFRTRTS